MSSTPRKIVQFIASNRNVISQSYKMYGALYAKSFSNFVYYYVFLFELVYFNNKLLNNETTCAFISDGGIFSGFTKRVQRKSTN